MRPGSPCPYTIMYMSTHAATRMLRFSATTGDCFKSSVIIAYNATPITTECITMVNPRSVICLNWIGFGSTSTRENKIKHVVQFYQLKIKYCIHKLYNI